MALTNDTGAVQGVNTGKNGSAVTTNSDQISSTVVASDTKGGAV